MHDDAGNVMRRAEAGSYDVIFLDAEREDYVGWWPDLRRLLRAGGLLVVDNATSHAGEMAPFVALVADATFTTSLAPSRQGRIPRGEVAGLIVDCGR